MKKIKIKVLKEFLLTATDHWKKFWLLYALGGVGICLVLVAFAFRAILPKPSFLTSEIQTKEIAEPEEDDEPAFRHPLTGAVSDFEIERPQVFAVMVENSADAWPLSGVEEAFLVIEAPVEAKIPRFVAFYSSEQKTEKIGPVRSARPYYLDWALELDALYAHVGGSPEALNLINKNDIFDLNEFWNGNYFWRSATRSAPHNTYTSLDLLNKALVSFSEKNLVANLDYGIWQFKNDDPAELSEDRETDISLNSVEPSYQVTWKYNSENNDYKRWKTGGGLVTTSNGQEIRANNVAVVYTEISVIDNVGRRDIITVGQGGALVLQDGRLIEAIWKKESANDRLRFYAEDGKEIKWNAGKTWIEIMSTTEK